MNPSILLIAGGATLLIAIALMAIIWRQRSSSTSESTAKSQKKSQPTPAKKPADDKGLLSSSKPVKKTEFIADPKEVDTPSVSFEPLPAEAPLIGAGEVDDPGQKIRILIVDDNEQTTENVSRLIYFEDDMQVIGQAYDGRQGIEMAIKLKPHIVLMDINMPDIDGITATEQIAEKVPYSQVIIMSVQADPQYMRQAMTAGARDYQAKPFTADELVSCIRRVYKIGMPIYQQYGDAVQQQADPGHGMPLTRGTSGRQFTGNAPVVVIYSPKGGLGVSVIATNLAVILQKAKGETILMDGDLQFGDIMVLLNTRANRSMSNLVNLDEMDAELVSQVLSTHKSELKMLLAPHKPELAEFLQADRVTEMVKYLKMQAKMVVVDTPSLLNEQTLAMLDMADYVLLVTTPELPAVKSARMFLELLHDLEFNTDQVGVVVNRADLEDGLAGEQISQALKLDVVAEIPVDRRILATVNQGAPICLANPGAPASKAMVSLAKFVWDAVQPNAEEQTAASTAKNGKS